MEVSFQEDMNTHAVLGGQKSRAFSIANTSEFITVLSDSLYSNKKLAVIREVLFNAWDATKAGKSDKPVEITLLPNKMIIRDHGLGIHDDHVESIYCRYGESTKLKEDDQTGGFGLGSKAPFAYTHHFTVTSHHNGTKTVYAISRGSEETDFLPEIKTMVAVPTTQSGLEVNIPIKSDEDMNTFNQYIISIARFANMNVLLNNVRIDKLIGDLDPKFPYFISAVNPYNLVDGQIICVRYGGVIYPVMPNPDYEEMMKTIEMMFKDSYARHYSHRNRTIHIIMDLPPNSVSVAPSREQLSYSTVTVRTITETLVKLKNDLTFNIDKLRIDIADNIIDSLVTNNVDLLEEYYHNHISTGHYTKAEPKMFYKDKDTIFKQYLYERVYKDPVMMRIYRNKIRAKIKKTPFNKAALKIIDIAGYVETIKKKNRQLNYNEIHKHVPNPELFWENYIYRMMYNQFGKEVFKNNYTISGYYHKITDHFFSSEKYGHYLFNRNILISYNKAYAKEYHSRKWTDAPLNLIIVSRKEPDRIATLVEGLTLIGFNVIDLTSMEGFNEPTTRAPALNKVVRLKGYPLLNNNMFKSIGSRVLVDDFNKSPLRIEDPTIVLHSRTQDKELRIDNPFHGGVLNRTEINNLMTIFPDQIAIVASSSVQSNANSKLGLDNPMEMLSEAVNLYKDNPDFLYYVSLKFGYLNEQYRKLSIVPEVSKFLSFFEPKDETVKALVELVFDDEYYFERRCKLSAIKDHARRTVTHLPSYKDITKATNLRFIKEEAFALASEPETPDNKDERKFAVNFILQAVKG